MLPEWQDEHAPNQGRVLLEERVAEPVDDAGQEVPGEIPCRGAERREPEGRAREAAASDQAIGEREPQRGGARNGDPLHERLPAEALGMERLVEPGKRFPFGRRPHRADSTRKVAAREGITGALRRRLSSAASSPRQAREFSSHGPRAPLGHLASHML
jgi:hypothetical protein